MANDNIPAWFMQAMQAADLIASVKDGTFSGAFRVTLAERIADTLSKIAYKAILQQFQAEYVKELMPR